jgi:hypothetical protein
MGIIKDIKEMHSVGFLDMEEDRVSETPVSGQKLIIRIQDNGTTRALTWNAIFEVVGTTLPTDTTANKKHYIGCIYNSDDTKWDVLGVAEEA